MRIHPSLAALSIFLIGCHNRLVNYEPPAPPIIDIHAHFFNYCDFPEQALVDKFHVGDKTAIGCVAKSFAKRWMKRADPNTCNNPTNGSQGTARLRQKKPPHPKNLLAQLDFVRAIVSDRLALAYRYFEMYPEVDLVTPSLVDVDGWINFPDEPPPTATWETRHKVQRQLAHHINVEANEVRVLPIAGFNRVWPRH